MGFFKYWIFFVLFSFFSNVTFLNLCPMQIIDAGYLNYTTGNPCSLCWNHVFHINFVYYMKILPLWHQSVNYFSQWIWDTSINFRSFIVFLGGNWHDIYVHCAGFLTLSRIQVFTHGILIIVKGIIVILHSRHLLVQSQQCKRKNNMWNLLKVNDKDNRKTPMTSCWCPYC